MGDNLRSEYPEEKKIRKKIEKESKKALDNINKSGELRESLGENHDSPLMDDGSLATKDIRT